MKLLIHSQTSTVDPWVLLYYVIFQYVIRGAYFSINIQALLFEKMVLVQVIATKKVKMHALDNKTIFFYLSSNSWFIDFQAGYIPGKFCNKKFSAYKLLAKQRHENCLSIKLGKMLKVSKISVKSQCDHGLISWRYFLCWNDNYKVLIW